MDGCLCLDTLCLEGEVLEGCLSCDYGESGWDRIMQSELTVFRYFRRGVKTRMPRENSYHSILLGDALGRTFHQEQWQDLIDHVSFHKLNYRKVGEVSRNPKGYYWHIMK